MPSSTVRIRIRVTIGANVTDYWYFETCHSCKNYNEVLFLERYGGRCTVLFDCKPSVSVNTSYQEIFRHVGVIPNDSDTVYDQKLLSTGGRTIANKQSWESVTLTKVLPDDPKIIDFYKEFLSSHSYHLRYEKNQWERGYIKFIVESGSIRIYEDSEEPVLQITGRYHLPENMATDGQ